MRNVSIFVDRRRMVGNKLRSEINFGNWSVQMFGNEVTDAEMRIQKRRQCRQPPVTAPKALGAARKRLPAAKVPDQSQLI